MKPITLLVGITLAALLLGTYSATAQAQSESTTTAFNAQLFKPAPGRYSLLTIETARIPRPLTYSLGLFYGYQRNPLVLKNQGSVVEKALGNMHTLDLLFSISVLPFIEVGAHLSMHMGMTGSGGQGIGGISGTFDSAAPGDSRLWLKFRILGRKRKGFGLAITTPVIIPTGQSRRFHGDRGMGFAPRIIMDWFAHPRFRLAGYLGYHFRYAVNFGDLLIDDEILYGIGAAVVILKKGSWERLTAIGEIYGMTSAVQPFRNENQNTMDAVIALKYHFGKSGLSLLLGAGRGVLPGYASPAFRIFLGVGWHRPN